MGYDYLTYYTLIENEEEAQILYLFSPLSIVWAEIALYFESPQMLFVLFGLPTFALLIFTLKKYSKDYALSVTILICFFFLHHSVLFDKLWLWLFVFMVIVL